MQEGRHAEGDEPERQRHDRIEATGRQAEPRQQMSSTITGAGANGGADDELKQDLEGNPQTRRRARLEQIGVSTVVRMTAIGSLMPDSTSRVTPTRRFSCRPLPRSTEKTAAASVEDTTAPISSASGQPRPSNRPPAATSSAVPADAEVASTPAGARPSARHRAEC